MSYGQRTVVIERKGYDFDLRDHGIPVDQGLVLSYRVGRDPVSGGERIYVGINAAPTVLVVIDPATGAGEQFSPTLPPSTKSGDGVDKVSIAGGESSSGPWDIAVTPDGRVLIVHSFGHLHVFDPRTKSLHVAARTPEGAWQIVRGDDGKYYLGSSKPARLLRFDLDTGTIEDLGVLDPRNHMARGLATCGDGYVYASAASAAATIMAFEIATGRKHAVLPTDEERPGGHALIRGIDGRAYVRSVAGKTYRLDHGMAIPIPADQVAAPRPVTLANGDVVRYNDMKPDRLFIGDGAATRTVPLKYTTTGSKIFHIARGPNDVLYGSTIMPLYLFRYDPRRGEAESLGRGAPASGEIYSFGVCDDKLYYATYGGNGFLVYDPSLPYRIGDGYHDWHYNPRFISEMGAGHCRPRAMVVDTRKRIWVGSNPGPEYGGYDGGLFCYDTATAAEHNNPCVIANHAIMALTADDTGELVFGGTELNRGGNEATAAQHAVAFAWDTAARRLRWSVTPVPGETGITNLIHLRGKLYGTTRPKGHYFVLDAATGQVDRVMPSPISDAAEQSMGLASDGNFYGTTWPSLFRWKPGGEPETLCVVWGEEVRHYRGAIFRGSSAIIQDRIYFFCGERLLSMRLPLGR